MTCTFYIDFIYNIYLLNKFKFFLTNVYFNNYNDTF